MLYHSAIPAILQTFKKLIKKLCPYLEKVKNDLAITFCSWNQSFFFFFFSITISDLLKSSLCSYVYCVLNMCLLHSGIYLEAD